MAGMADNTTPRPRRIALPARGGDIAALEFGPQDRPIDVVFSHANGFNALTYRAILAPVAEGLRILAYDLRGHGATDLPTQDEGRTDWSDMGEDLTALLQTLDLKDVVLAGHSMGGATSILAANHAPERVRALALFEPVILPRVRKTGGAPGSGPTTEATLRRRNSFESREQAVAAFVGRGAFTTWPRPMVEDYVAAGLKPLPGGGFTLACTPAWEASGYRAHGNEVWPILDRLTTPIRILKGDIWSTTWVDEERRALEATGRVRIETIAGASHFLPMEHPDRVAQVLGELAGVQ